jgi:dihydropteroate synthase
MKSRRIFVSIQQWIMTKTTLSANGKLLDLATPKIMGILNVTPDSFFDGGKYHNIDIALEQVSEMVQAGAAIIDIGGMSSRPGAALIPVEEESKRVIPILKEIRSHFPDIWISIDTIRSEVVEEAAHYGMDMVNDISAGGIDPNMFRVIGELGLPYVLMHMQGVPSNMQLSPHYEDVMQEVLRFLIHRIRSLNDYNVKDVIIDPGFGFGKTVEDNYLLLQNLHLLQILDLPILVGISRKSMICKVLDVSPQYALNGSSALHIVALQQGAKILRVHDVKEAKEVIDLFQQFTTPLRSS